MEDLFRSYWWLIFPIWGIAMGALVAVYGWDAVLTQLAWFFTKAALLTLGSSLVDSTMIGTSRSPGALRYWPSRSRPGRHRAG